MKEEQFKELQETAAALLTDGPVLNLFIHRVKEKNRFFNEKYPEVPNAFSILIKMCVEETKGLPQLWYDSMRYL